MLYFIDLRVRKIRNEAPRLFFFLSFFLGWQIPNLIRLALDCVGDEHPTNH